MSRPLKVFLSHAHADADAVRTLYDRLVADGVDAWLDKEKLIPGQDWEREIRKAVREADVVIVCLSKQFNQRGYRQKEVRIALDEADMMPEGEIFIIPARLEECEALESLHKWHWVDLFENGGYERLLRSLRLRDQKIKVDLQPKKSSISSLFNKPITQHSNDPKSAKPQDIQNRSIKSKKQRKPIKKEYIIAFVILAVIIIAVILNFPLIEKMARATPEPTKILTPIPSPSEFGSYFYVSDPVEEWRINTTSYLEDVLPNYAIQSWAWAPDGKSVLFPVLASENPQRFDTYIMRYGEDQSELLVEGGYNANFAEDGEGFCFQKNDRLWYYDLESGNSTVMLNNVYVNQIFLSSDGKKIYFYNFSDMLSDREASVHVLSIGSTESQRLLDGTTFDVFNQSNYPWTVRRIPVEYSN